MMDGCTEAARISSAANAQKVVTEFDKYRTDKHELTDRAQRNSLLVQLGRFCDTEQFSDVKIIVNGQVFNCHRIILGASCPYFRALFEHQPDHGTLRLDEVSASGFSALKHFMYTGQITLKDETLEDVFVAADFLQFRELAETSATMLLQHMEVNNCLRLLHLADSHSCRELLDEAIKFTLSHFKSVLWTDDFCNLPMNSLIQLLGHDHCYVDHELDILIAISRWLSGQQELKLEEMEIVVKSCNLALIEDADVKMCFKNYPVMGKSESFMKRVEMNNPCDLRVLAKVVEKRKQEVVVVIVKRALDDPEPWPAPRQVVTQVLYHDPYESRWAILTELPCDDRDMFRAAVVDNDIYIIGGVLNEAIVFGQVTDEVWKYHTQLDQWNKAMPMLKQRKNHGSASLHGKVYVIGGAAGDTHRLRRDGEVYDPHTNQWTLIHELRDIGGIGNPAVVPLNGRIYVIGGICSDRNSNSGPTIKWHQYTSAQCYDPRSDEWTNLDDLSQAIQSMNLKPAGNECLSYLGFIIFVDEDPYTNPRRPKSLKLYNPVTGKVDDFINHSYNRFGGYTMYRDEIVKTGGVRDSFYVQNLVYSCDLSQVSPDWITWAPMPCRSSHHSCFTLFLKLASKFTEPID